MDLTLKTGGREIRTEAERYGDTQFLSGEINAFAEFLRTSQFPTRIFYLFLMYT